MGGVEASEAETPVFERGEALAVNPKLDGKSSR